MTTSDPDLTTAAPASASAMRPGVEPTASRPGIDEARLIDLFMSRGFARIEPPVLQPLEPFLDLSGEDLRRRMFITADAEGHELCLRPEYTIPVSRLHLEQVAAQRSGAGQSAAYAYLGPVFRFRPGETGEFVQAGVEDFGRTDKEAADAEILEVALEALREMDIATSTTLIGDVGLFAALIDAMQLSGSTARRLRRSYAAGKIDAQALGALAAQTSSENQHAGLLAALQGQDPAAARLFVEDILKIAGISSISGRSAHQIAARFLEQASNQQSGLSPEQALVFERFLSIGGHPDEAADALRALAADAKLDLARAIETLDIRNGFMEARGIELAHLRFATGFGRNLDYYTGFVFEIRDAARPDSKPLVGGGRYDGLLRRLGAPLDVPAVGCSIWLDRILAGTPKSAGTP
ncbi:ATP phosphoribosyltransferase regulatory subunit [Rhizobiales bacterium GAS188]|nr:ATP phosphoribosyltransferase regulatory subunit [Rhizobiales bacterium GAS188]